MDLNEKLLNQMLGLIDLIILLFLYLLVWNFQIRTLIYDSSSMAVACVALG